MEQTIFIKDLANQQIGNAIGRLCVMADIEPPEDGKSIVEFLRDKFWKYDAMVIPSAFDAWMAGIAPEIMRVKKINMVFLSLVLNAYIQSHYHKIKRYAPPALEAPKPSPDELENLSKRSFELTTNQWLAVYRDKNRERISIKMMEISWQRAVQNGAADEFNESEISAMMNYINDYDVKYTQYIAKQMNNEYKTKRLLDMMNSVTAVNQNIESLRDAAKFALHTNKQFGIK